MSFFSDIGVDGFWEKVAFVVLSPVILPAAVAGAAYEGITGKEVFSRTEESNTQSEQEIRARIEREAKEKRAGEERVAIADYARKALLTLQTSHSNSTLPVATSLDFYKLKSAVHSTAKPVELVEQWLPHLKRNTSSDASDQETTRLNDEIRELKQLRQALLDLETEDVNL
jgi:hypothetical protein